MHMLIHDDAMTPTHDGHSVTSTNTLRLWDDVGQYLFCALHAWSILIFLRVNIIGSLKKKKVVDRCLQKCTIQICPQDGSAHLVLKICWNSEMLLLGIEIFNWLTLRHSWRLKRRRLRMLTSPQWVCSAVWINALWGSWGAAPTILH